MVLVTAVSVSAVGTAEEFLTICEPAVEAAVLATTAILLAMVTPSGRIVTAR